MGGLRDQVEKIQIAALDRTNGDGILNESFGNVPLER